MNNILIITQKVSQDDPILGFFHRWLIEFSHNYKHIVVICLEKDKFNLPSNVKVLSLGKEAGQNKIKYIFNFYKYIWRERKDYDHVFVHMNPIYVLLGGLLFKILQKKVYLWYTHKRVNWSLVLAEKIVDKIFTASSESLRLKTDKKVVTGHGIDTQLFKPNFEIKKENIFLTVGRISEVKNDIKMLRLVKQRPDFKLRFIGSPVTTADEIYFKKLKQAIVDEGLENNVEFIGNCSQDKLPYFYQKAKVFINFSDTGSVDKAVLEALAVNIPTLTTNEAFADNYPVYQDLDEALSSSNETRAFVETNHSLSNLIHKLKNQMS